MLNYADEIGPLAAERRLHFYELLAHNLTISIRGIWSEPDMADSEKLDRIYWLNETLHRITAKVYTLRLNLHEWTEEDIWAMIESHIAHNRNIEKDIMAGIKYSYNCAARINTEVLCGEDDA
jgi:hypothetical protein